jgi:beta-glucosidase-like glycosyl hydrolase
MIAMDAEWGLGMRLTGIKDLPRSMTLGATGDERWAYELGKTMGRQCKLLGVHINFAPVMDINNNPDNPVINFRSFGEDKENVTRKALAVARGLQEERVMACSKHFPGHGFVKADSHVDIPVDKISGTPEATSFFSNASSVSEAEATLIHTGSKVRRKSTEGKSQGEANQWMPSCFA